MQNPSQIHPKSIPEPPWNDVSRMYGKSTDLGSFRSIDLGPVFGQNPEKVDLKKRRKSSSENIMFVDVKWLQNGAKTPPKFNEKTM